MVDQEKLQKGRAWIYVIGVIVFFVVVLWRLVAH